MASTNTSQKLPFSIKLPSSQILLALFSIYFIWGATDLGNRFALESYPPFLLVALRLLLAMIILLGFLKVRGVPFPPTKQIFIALVIGGLMFGGRAGLVALARQEGLGRGIILLGEATVPLWAMVFAFFLGYRPGKLEIAGLVIGIFGMAILYMGSGMQFQPFGVILLLFSPMFWALGSMISTRVSIPQGFMGTAFQMVGGCISMFVLSFLKGEQFPANPTVGATLALILLSVFGTLIAFTAYMYLIQIVSPGLATSYSYVNPIVVIVLGAIVLGEAFPSTGIPAIIVIFISIVLIMLGRSKIIEVGQGSTA